jgi:hypothetical protein
MLFITSGNVFFITTLEGKKHYYIHDKQKKKSYFFAEPRVCGPTFPEKLRHHPVGDRTAVHHYYR